MSASAVLPGPIRLLLVEDDGDDVALIRDLLKEAPQPFELEHVTTLSAAIQRLGQGGIQLILTDLTLPDSLGVENVGIFRGVRPEVPIIVLSGHDDEAFALETVKQGAQDYLVKGRFTQETLTRAIRYALERAEADQALAAERNLLRSVIDNLMDAIYVKDAQDRYLLGNFAHARQLGLAGPEEVIGKGTRDLFAAPIAEKFLEDDQRVIREGEAIINRHERADAPGGDPRWLSTTKIPLRDRAGRIIGLIGIGRDITSRKQAEEQLARYTRELQERNAQLEDDLKMAREVQLAFLPQQFPSFPGHLPPEESALRFYSRYLPATVLGGDFFHVFPISDTQAGVLICDVMGHGVRAALVTAIHRALMEELQEFAADPAAFLTHMNQALLSILRRTRSPLFATAFYLAVDLSTGRMRFANAGHPRPFHLRRGRDEIALLQGAAARPGPALGVFEGSTYTNHETFVAPDDLIMLFTDGLYEVENSAGEWYDQTHLQEVVQAALREGTDGLFDRAIDAARQFSATSSFSDDVCMVGVEICRLLNQARPLPRQPHHEPAMAH